MATAAPSLAPATATTVGAALLAGGAALGAAAVRARSVRARAAAAAAAMRHRAAFDPLTGLRNRISFGDRVDAEIRAGAEPLSVLLLDLDHFAGVRRTLGRAVGDR